MTDRPIIFSAPMVRALLDGRKTMTRRLAWRDAEFGWQDYASEHLEDFDVRGWKAEQRESDGLFKVFKPTYWQRVKPGDRLWVRETWSFYEGIHQGSYGFVPPEKPTYPPHYVHPHGGRRAVVWRAGTENNAWGMYGEPRWRSPIHCPRTASRLTLIVTAVKIERLQEISEEDATAEGIETGGKFGFRAGAIEGSSARGAFQNLWKHLHGPAAWDANPEVVALSLTVHKQNIDAMSRAEAA